jgi:hypothetical protein
MWLRATKQNLAGWMRPMGFRDPRLISTVSIVHSFTVTSTVTCITHVLCHMRVGGSLPTFIVTTSMVLPLWLTLYLSRTSDRYTRTFCLRHIKIFQYSSHAIMLTHNAALLRTIPSCFLCCHDTHSVLHPASVSQTQRTIHNLDSLGMQWQSKCNHSHKLVTHNTCLQTYHPSIN